MRIGTQISQIKIHSLVDYTKIILLHMGFYYMCSLIMQISRFYISGIGKEKMDLVPVIVFTIITIGLVFLAHVHRFIMEHRIYCSTFFRRQR